MIKIILATFLAVFSFCLSASAQVDSTYIFYDFKKKLLYHKDTTSTNVINNINKIKVKPNTRVTFQVLNLNRYLYNIEFSAEDNEFGSEPPALFTQLFLGQGDFINGLLAKASVAQASVEFVAEDSTQSGNFIEKLTAFMKKYNELMDSKVAAYSICTSVASKCATTCDQRLKYSDIANELLSLKVSYHTFHSELLNQLNDVTERIDVAQKKVNECKKKNEDLAAQLKNEANPSKRRKIEAELKKLNCEDEESHLTEHKEAKKLQESLKSDSEKLWEVFSKITDENLMKLVLFQNNLVNDHFSYTSPPIYPRGNYLDIGLKITPSDSSLARKWNILPLAADSFGISLFVKGKTYVSFSSGPFLAIGGSIRHNTFGWQAQPDRNGVISDSSQYKLMPTGKAGQPIGLSAFANLGIQVARGFAIGLSPGVGITVEEKPRPAYLLGLSILLGEQRQFNLTVGGLFTHADRLKSELYPDMGTRFYASKLPTIEYNSELQKGAFVALSYTFHTLHKTRSTKSK